MLGIEPCKNTRNDASTTELDSLVPPIVYITRTSWSNYSQQYYTPGNSDIFIHKTHGGTAKKLRLLCSGSALGSTEYIFFVLKTILLRRLGATKCSEVRMQPTSLTRSKHGLAWSIVSPPWHYCGSMVACRNPTNHYNGMWYLPHLQFR